MNREENIPSAAERFIEDQTRSGRDMTRYRNYLRRPERIPPHLLLELANECECELGDLLALGFGLDNSIAAIDRAANELGSGVTLQVVQHRA